MINRPLEFYESIHANQNMCAVLFIEAKLTKNEIDQAWYLTQVHHPFLRMELQNDEDAPYKLRFQEKISSKSIPDQQFRSEIVHLTKDGWHAILQKMANQPRQQCPEMWYIWLRSNPKQTRHELYFLFNHSGSDGPAVFAIIQTFLNYLDKILSNQPIPEVQSLEFLNLLDNFPSNASEIPSPYPTGPFLPFIKRQSTLDPSTPAQFSEVSFAIGKRKTKSLLNVIKKHNVTPQAAFVCAEMLAVSINSLSDTPLPHHIAPNILVDLRKYVDPPISKENSVCASASLIWEQDARAEDKLWDLVQEAGRFISEGLAAKYALKYRIDRQYHPEIVKFTFMNSSIGRVPTLPNHRYLKLHGAGMIAGGYNNYTVASNWTITHAYTIQDCFNVSFQYANPSFSLEWATHFLKIMEKFLSDLVTDRQKNQTVAQFIAKIQKEKN